MVYQIGEIYLLNFGKSITAEKQAVYEHASFRSMKFWKSISVAGIQKKN